MRCAPVYASGFGVSASDASNLLLAGEQKKSQVSENTKKYTENQRKKFEALYIYIPRITSLLELHLLNLRICRKLERFWPLNAGNSPIIFNDLQLQ